MSRVLSSATKAALGWVCKHLMLFGVFNSSRLLCCSNLCFLKNQDGCSLPFSPFVSQQSSGAHCSLAQYWPKFWPMLCGSVPGTWTGTETPGEMSPERNRSKNKISLKLSLALTNEESSSVFVPLWELDPHLCWSWLRADSAGEGRSTLRSQNCVEQKEMEATCRSMRRPTGEEWTEEEESRRGKQLITFTLTL